MKKLFLGFLTTLLCNALAAQDTAHQSGPVLMEIQKPVDTVTVKKDSVAPTFEHGYANVYFMPSSSFNKGTVVAPILYPPNTIISSTNNYYSAYGDEKAGTGYAFGIEYETKEYFKRFYVGIGGELQRYTYSGTVTQVTTYGSGASKDSIVKNLGYTWSVTDVSVPIRIHVMAYQNTKIRLDVAFGASIGVLQQSNNADASEQGDDTFTRTYMFGVFGLGFEYNFMREDLLRVEPCYYYGFGTSPDGRRLASFGLRLGFMFD